MSLLNNEPVYEMILFKNQDQFQHRSISLFSSEKVLIELIASH